MQISDVISEGNVYWNLSVTSKKRCLEAIADILEKRLPGYRNDELLDALLARERLGSTALGQGIAIPHCRLPGLGSPQCLAIKLETPIDFDAPDHKPVDLVFVLVVPDDGADDHVALLAALAEKLSNPEVQAALRKSFSAETFYTRLTENTQTQAKAAS